MGFDGTHVGVVELDAFAESGTFGIEDFGLSGVAGNLGFEVRVTARVIVFGIAIGFFFVDGELDAVNDKVFAGVTAVVEVVLHDGIFDVAIGRGGHVDSFATISIVIDGGEKFLFVHNELMFNELMFKERAIQLP